VVAQAHISSVVVRSDEKERERVHKAKMDEVAKLILEGATAPPWLRDFLSDWSFEVCWSHSVETITPTKKELSERLISIYSLAAELSKVLESPMTSGFLAVGAGRETEKYFSSEVVPMLSVLMADAAKARKSIGLFTPDGNVRPGRGRPHLPGRMPAKYVCAAIIAEVWASFHNGEYPTSSNRHAQAAAARYYGAWFPAGGWGTDALKGWKNYLAAIDSPDLFETRKEVRRILAIEGHRDAMMRAENNAQ
jgi:hypothetical protein